MTRSKRRAPPSAANIVRGDASESTVRDGDTPAGAAVFIGLNAAIVSVSDETPQVVTLNGSDSLPTPDGGTISVDSLPFGPFEPLKHRTLEIGLRNWVRDQTGLQLGYVEQLYTFGDRGRHATDTGSAPQVVSIGYIALTASDTLLKESGTTWHDWYAYFPWEDWRDRRPPILEAVIEPHLKTWIEEASQEERKAREDRFQLCFGHSGLRWDEERVLERYELLYEAGLLFEAQRDRPELHADKAKSLPVLLGDPMEHDHRRILATAISRLRSKLKYRPLVFELMPPSFTLLQLQRTVEAVSGVRLHKQNFRRLLEKGGLVERTGAMTTKTGGRPAELFRFRGDVLKERLMPGGRLPAPTPR